MEGRAILLHHAVAGLGPQRSLQQLSQGSSRGLAVLGKRSEGSHGTATTTSRENTNSLKSETAAC